VKTGRGSASSHLASQRSTHENIAAAASPAACARGAPEDNSSCVKVVTDVSVPVVVCGVVLLVSVVLVWLVEVADVVLDRVLVFVAVLVLVSVVVWSVVLLVSV